MSDDIPCECECEKFEIDPFLVYGGTYPPFSVDGDVFQASAAVDASSSVTLRVSGILPAPVNAVTSWTPAYDMKQAVTAGSSVSIQGASKPLTRSGARIPVRFDACAVGQDLLLTASAECSAKLNPAGLAATYGGFLPTAMNFYKVSSTAGIQNWPLESQRSSWLLDIYAQEPPDGVWGNAASSFEIYRDGVLIASFDANLIQQDGKKVADIHPFPASVVTQCSQEGSYLVIARHNSAVASGAGVVHSFGKAPSPIVSYGSFVILNTKYAFAARLDNDRFQGEFASENPPGPGGCDRENPFKERVESAGLDVAGNGPLFSGPLPAATVFQVPEGGNLGARGSFVRPSPFGGDASLVLDLPLAKLKMRFDKPVVGIAAGMFSVAGYAPPDGAPATLPVVSVSPLATDGREYEVAIGTSGQVPNSMWIITFTPTSAVGVQSASGTDYGITILSARFMWCIAKDKSIGRYWINTFPESNHVIPRASASTTVTPESRPEGDMSLTLLTSTDEVIDPSSSKRATLSDQGRTDFLPRLPANSTTPTNGRFSYFGVPTTIHPAAPAWIGDCASPSESQRHASLIFTENDIAAFSATNPSTLSIPQGSDTGTRLAGPAENVPGILPRPKTDDIESLTFNLSAESLSQNFWAQIGKSVSLVRLGQDDCVETTISSISVVMSANRGRLTYRELQTTTVTELLLTLHVWCTGTFRWRQPEYQYQAPFWVVVGHSQQWSEPKQFTSGIEQIDIIVPPDREANFGSLEDTQGRAWTITKG